MGVSMGVPPNGWFIVENAIRMDDLGVPPYFRKPPYLAATVGVQREIFSHRQNGRMNHAVRGHFF